MNYEEYREKYGMFADKIEESDTLPDNFNIFRVLGLDSLETRHSNFLKWLLQYRYEGKRVFLGRWLKALGKVLEFDIDETELENVKINREERFSEVDEQGRAVIRHSSKKGIYFRNIESDPVRFCYYLEKTKDGTVVKTDTVIETNSDYPFKIGKEKTGGRYIDINIIGKNFTLTIENKVDSGEHDFQCIAYRNYMETNPAYSGKAHYYLFLAKEQPDPFVTDKNGVYPDYRFSDYRMIRLILSDMLNEGLFKEDAVSTQIVRQYVTLLNDWEKLPPRYRAILEEAQKEPWLRMLPDFQDGAPANQLNELLADGDLPETDRHFIEIARQYYLQNIKKPCDDALGEILEKVCVAYDPANGEKYGRGKYAHALFLNGLIGLPEATVEATVFTQELYDKIIRDIAENSDTSVRKANKCRKYLNGVLSDAKRAKFEDTVKKNYLNEKKRQAPKFDTEEKEKLPFNSIDYRAPRDGRLHPSLCILSGLIAPGCKALCARLTEESFLSALDRLQKSGWEVSLSYVIKNGSGYKERFRIPCSFEGLRAMSREERKACFDLNNGRYANLLRGKKTRSSRHDPDFNQALQLLTERGVFTGEDLKTFNADMDSYFDNKKEVNLTWLLELTCELSDGEMTPVRIRQRSVEGAAVFGPKYEALFDRYVFLPAEQLAGEDA